MPGATRTPLEFGASVAQVLVAAFTGWLAWSTRGLATETRRMASETAELARGTVAATQAAERHHTEQMRPLLLLDAALTVIARNEDRGGITYMLSLDGDVCNFGGGAATAVLLVISPHGQVDHEIPLAVIGPNTRFSLKGAQWSTWSTAHKPLHDPWPFHAVLGYSTAGFTTKVGTTKQSSHSGLATDLRVEFLSPTDTENIRQ